MFKKENLIKLQDSIKKDDIDAYLIFTTDPHFSEYCSEKYLRERHYFCPFSGSAGQVLVTKEQAFLFTDGRYWIQAASQLEGSGIILVKAGDKGVLGLEDYIKSLDIKKLGVNFQNLSNSQNEKFKLREIITVDKDYTNLIEEPYEEKISKVFKLDDSLNTLSSSEKIDEILLKVEEKGAEANFISSLDDIAWILNIRGKDIPNNPVFYSYLYLSKSYGNHLFIDRNKIDFEINNVIIHDYEEVFEFLKEHRSIKTLIDPSKASLKVLSNLDNLVYASNPSFLMKAIKGEREIENIKKIQAIDGVALLRFQKYLEENLDSNLSEYDYSEKLKQFRLENPLCFDLSFGSIVAVGANAAQMHYAPSKEKSSIVNKDSIELLVDSGGQYYGGTTDTTRTFLIGKPTEEYKHDYTITLKALINLSRTIFLKGSNGQTIDIRSREFFWKEGMDYKCGTGHGVGYILNVHEGPNGFRYRRVPDREDQGEIVPGMVTTIEPGVYKQDKYGIRIENNLLCVKAFDTSDGEFYKFETITYVPITTESLDFSLLNEDEIEWVNEYHKIVYKELEPLIKNDKELLKFLSIKTKKISK